MYVRSTLYRNQQPFYFSIVSQLLKHFLHECWYLKYFHTDGSLPCYLGYLHLRCNYQNLYPRNTYHWRIQRGAEGTFAPTKKQKTQINTHKNKWRRMKTEREKRGSVSSPQIIIITCKSILIFLHHTFHKHLRQ